MIRKLSIRNYAIISALEIDFPAGLTIITGETGAGKSILLGALGLIMGERADSRSLFNEAEKCVIEGWFDLSGYDLREFFEAHDIDYDESCVIRRELTPAGKSRAFVNDTPVNLEVLRRLTGALVDLHQQFDTLDIHQVSFQLRMVDALAGNHGLLAQYQAGFRHYTKARNRLQDLRAAGEKASQEREFLQFQLREFQAANLEADEQERLESLLDQLTHAEALKRTLTAASHFITDGELPLSSQLNDLQRQLADVRRYHPLLPELHRRLEALALELDDLAGEFDKLAEETEYDPERIKTVQERLDTLYRLQHKHRVSTVGELLDIQRKLEQQLDGLDHQGVEMAELEKEVAERTEQLLVLARELSGRRRETAPVFAGKVREMLAQLSMPHTRFEIAVDTHDILRATGLDDIGFRFAANPGSRLQAIRDVASGGELSRLTLVTKSLVASAIPLPTLIFDEIDQGVSGDVALQMGNILRRLSNQHQVVVITHSPQVASKADAHYFIFKSVQDGTTTTSVRLLDPAEQIKAIAVMLSQNPPSEAALANARDLMERQV
jgi:DNA repair protein RecN (Recombination protein N)